VEKDIKDLTKEEMLNPGFVPSILEYCDAVDNKEEILNEIMTMAKHYRITSNIKNQMTTWNNKRKITTTDIIGLLEFTENGQVAQTTTNYVTILENDPEYQDLFLFDEFSNRIIYYDKDGIKRMWSDGDDSRLRCGIENKYGLYHLQKYYDAFNVVARGKSFHTIKELIEAGDWDKTPRIDRFLVDILKCEDNDYHREVSRMIFYGGIHRLYQPGCKFDYMPILIGKQGCGKSTVVKWLALHDAYYGDISSIEGKDALENIQGIWICELSELLAMVKTKDVEAMKSFITRTTDRFRESYGRRTKEYPRSCVFIGTTNDYQFLSDKTGNRRYLPVELNVKMGELYDQEQYIRDYILQCWREARYLYMVEETYLTIPSKYYNEVVIAQDNAVEDDPKVGMILDYLNQKKVGDRVCNIEIFTNCLNGLKKNFDRLQSKEISRLLASLPEWKRHRSTHRFDDFGTQKFWEKIEIKDAWGDLD
jgi:predicted P-loop ATPase